MLSKIKKYLNKEDNSSSKKLNIGILSNNKINDFKEVNIVYTSVDDNVPQMDVCFLDHIIPQDILDKIQEKTDLMVSLGFSLNFKADITLPGISFKDEFLNKVIKALVDDNLDYFKPLINIKQGKTISITLDNKLCTGCSGCAFICPIEAIIMENMRPKLDVNKCVTCGSCFMICPKTWDLSEEVKAWY